MFSFSQNMILCSEPSLNAGNLLIIKKANKQIQLSYKTSMALHHFCVFFPCPLFVYSLWWLVNNIEYYEELKLKVGTDCVRV